MEFVFRLPYLVDLPGGIYQREAAFVLHAKDLRAAEDQFEAGLRAAIQGSPREAPEPLGEPDLSLHGNGD